MAAAAPVKPVKAGLEETPQDAAVQHIRITLSCMNNVKNLEKGEWASASCWPLL